MKLYTVRKEAMYLHDLVGVFDTKQMAEKVAMECAESDVDDWHNYVVGSVVVGGYAIDPEHNMQWSKHIQDCITPIVSYSKEKEPLILS
jgi:hypothetical protein